MVLENNKTYLIRFGFGEGIGTGLYWKGQLPSENILELASVGFKIKIVNTVKIPDEIREILSTILN